MIKEKLQESVNFMEEKIKIARMSEFAVMMTPAEARNVLTTLKIALFKIEKLEYKIERLEWSIQND